jgi:hypothetical protein
VVALEGETSEAYIPTLADVGGSLMFAATPVLLDGTKGTRVFAVSADVQAAEPTAAIEGFIGEMREGGVVESVVAYSGGEQGECRMQWYRCAVDDPYGAPKLIVGENEASMVLRAADVGMILMLE